MSGSRRVLVCGAGGMIGGALVQRLADEGCDVTAVDIKPVDRWYRNVPTVKSFGEIDLSKPQGCQFALRSSRARDVYMLAADMGGMGYIANHKFACMSSVLISANMMREAVRSKRVERFLFSSSACVYNDELQQVSDVSLRESDAVPSMPEPGYGDEKLFSEFYVRQAGEEFDLKTYAPRLHNVYSTFCTFDGGREKAPAAICRKVAQAVLSGDHTIDIWGDGTQTRSFMWIDDCLEGFERLLQSDYHGPLNLGSSELVSINELVSIVENIAGVKLERNYNLNAPVGVQGRNSNNELIREVLGWEPSTPLADGMSELYAWVYDMVKDGKSGL